MGVITKVALKKFTRVARGDISQYADVINQAASTVINETADEGVCFGTPEEAPPGDVFINNAFFAKKKEESGTIKYTVVSGDTLSGIASAHDTTVEAIKAKNNIENANAIKVGQELEVPSGEEEGTVSFEAITSANVGDEVYVVVEHFGKVNSVQVTLKEKESLLTDGEALPVLQDDKEVSTITLCEPEEESLKGRYYCAEIKLRPEKDETLDSWREKLGEKELLGYTDTLNQRTVSPDAIGAASPVGMEPIYGDTVKSLLSIEVEAQAEEGEVVYCGRDRSNVFLNEEGEWFEVGYRQDGYVIRANGTIEIGRLQNEKVRYYIENKNEDIEFVGEFVKNDNELIQLPSDFSFVSDSSNSSFSFSIKSGNEYRSYISPISLAAIMGAMSEANVHDITIVGFSVVDGSSPAPSTSHINGRNGDFRYLRKDKSGGALYINNSPEDLDEGRQNEFNDALYKYGYTDLLSYNYVINGEERLLNHSRHYSNHHHHIHIQGFNPTTKIIEK